MTLPQSSGMAQPTAQRQAPLAAGTAGPCVFATDPGSAWPGSQPATPPARTVRLAAALHRIESRLASRERADTKPLGILGTALPGGPTGPVVSETPRENAAEPRGRLASTLVRLEPFVQPTAEESGLGAWGDGAARAVKQSVPRSAFAHPTHASPKSAAVCFELASRLWDQRPRERPAVLLLTCSAPEDATGDVVLALAQGLVAQVAGEVLMLDAHRQFGSLEPADSPTGATAEQGPWAPNSTLPDRVAWDRLAVRCPTERLSMLSYNQLGLDPARAPDGWFWAELLGKLRQAYRLVVVWTGAVQTPETHHIARYADATCLMIRSGRTGCRAGRRAVRALERLGARLLGCVIVAEDG